MKKIIFFTISCLLLVGSVDAQRRVYRQPRRVYTQPRQAQHQQYRGNDWYTPTFGVAIGTNFSNVIESGYSNYSSGTLVGLNVGLTADLPIAYPFSFAPEVRYSQKGYTVATTTGDFTQRTHFIDVPLLAKFKVAPSFNILVGPQFSFLLSTTNTFDNGTIITREHYNDNDNQKTFLDGVIGVSFDINRNVDIHGRYTVNFQQTDGYGNTYVPEYRNQVWQIGLGFKF